MNNTLSIATNNSGTLLINLDTGEYTYTSQKTTAVVITENIGFTVSDNDGDLASSTLTVKVIPNAPPVAMDDHVITNVLSGNIVVPGELLLANDTDPMAIPSSHTDQFQHGLGGQRGGFHRHRRDHVHGQQQYGRQPESGQRP